jgi:Rps23 Pro-64 3,4-dihydroxylase Tpa1-like proline 4-hydroxylase
MFVALMLDQGEGDPAAFRGLAELCRQTGALDEARQLYARVVELEPADAKSRALVAVLDGQPMPRPANGGAAWPTPFVRVLDFLPSDIHAEVRAITLEALPRFVASGVYEEGRGRIDPSQRMSSVLPQPAAHRRLFLPYVEEAVERCGVAGVLGVDPIRLQRYELQVTHHGDGAFFKAHNDNGNEINRYRTVSFVYYFHVEPKRFGGGSLLLFDADLEAERYSSGSFTRIEPTNNSIVFFPSSAPHEVERVAVETGEPTDGRFSLNGWILEANASSL